MAQFSTNSDFTADAPSTVAHGDGGSASTAITGFTALWPTGVFEDLRTFTVTTGGDDQYVAAADGGYGDSPQLLAMNGPGSITAGTETDVLFRFRLNNIPDSGGAGVGRVRYSNLAGDPKNYYAFFIGGTGEVSLHFWAGMTPGDPIGSVVAKGLAADTWYWARIHVSAGGQWSWKIWSGTFASEGGWDIGNGGASGLTEVSSTSGYVGIGFSSTAGTNSASPVDFDWFSAGTDGSVAPGPAVSSPTLTAAPGSLTLTGASALFSIPSIIASPGTLTLTGGNATLGAQSGVTLTASPGTLHLSAQIGFIDYALISSPGSLAFTGANISASGGTGVRLTASPGTITFTGGNIVLDQERTYSALPGNLTITGRRAILIPFSPAADTDVKGKRFGFILGRGLRRR